MTEGVREIVVPKPPAPTGITPGRRTRVARSPRKKPPGSPPGWSEDLMAPEVPNVLCPHCRAENPPGSETCASCGKEMVLLIGPGGREVSQAPRAGVSRRAVRLSTLMLVIALLGVCLAVMHEVPGLGILLTLLVVPALVRTYIGVAERQAWGEATSWNEKLLIFLGSLGIVSVLALSAAVAFVAACAPTGCAMLALGNGNAGNFSSFSSIGVIIPVVAGLAFAGFVLYHLGRRLWPQRDL